MKEFIQLFKEQHKEDIETLQNINKALSLKNVVSGSFWIELERLQKLTFSRREDLQAALHKRRNELETTLMQTFTEQLLEYYFYKMIYENENGGGS